MFDPIARFVRQLHCRFGPSNGLSNAQFAGAAHTDTDADRVAGSAFGERGRFDSCPDPFGNVYLTLVEWCLLKPKSGT